MLCPGWIGAALLCLEPVELADHDRVDPWELARAWSYEVVPMVRGSSTSLRFERAIWVDGLASRDDQGRQIAEAFAVCALEAAGEDPTDEAVAAVVSMLLEPRRRGPIGAIADVLDLMASRHERGDASGVICTERESGAVGGADR